MTHVETGTILDTILARTAADLVDRRAAQPRDKLESIAAERSDVVSLHDSLAQPGMSVIAEIKRASPSRGPLATAIDAPTVATDYVGGGAAAISVLTDEPFFQGSLQDMSAAAEIAHGAAPPVPILRKDFVIDEYQIVEARAFGADAILLIVAALGERQLGDLYSFARSLGLNVLVEVHDVREMERAIGIEASIIGINNRDLRTFAVDLAITERLAPLAPDGALIVAESGVFGPVEVQRLARAGADAILVGEGVITAANRVEAVAMLRKSVPS